MLACNNSTTLEVTFPMKEYVQIKPQVYCPLGPGFYSLGIRENLKQILGTRWLARVFLPVRGGVELRHGICPRAGVEGSVALRDRLRQVEEEGVKNEVRSCQELGFNPGPQVGVFGNVV